MTTTLLTQILFFAFQPEKLNVYKNDSDTSWDYTIGKNWLLSIKFDLETPLFTKINLHTTQSQHIYSFHFNTYMLQPQPLWSLSFFPSVFILKDICTFSYTTLEMKSDDAIWCIIYLVLDIKALCLDYVPKMQYINWIIYGFSIYGLFKYNIEIELSWNEEWRNRMNNNHTPVKFFSSSHLWFNRASAIHYGYW